MEIQSHPRTFPLGKTVITAYAHASLHAEDVYQALARHARGDWGELDAEAIARNERALQQGCYLLSAYTDRNGVDFWIMTEADRSATTVFVLEHF